jgi:ligand-binding sensor domain-containing protein
MSGEVVRNSALLCALMLTAILSMCQSPRPQPVVVSTTSSLPGAEIQCVLPPGTAWRVWHIAQDPPVVNTLLTDQDVLWAGTSLGLVRVDPQTGIFSRPLAYESSGAISTLLLTEPGRIWAVGQLGYFYYDGKQWTRVQVSGMALDFPDIWAVDQRGDLLAVPPNSARVNYHYRFSGHVPPKGGAWVAQQEPAYTQGSDVNGCNQSFASPWYSYRSIAECQALDRVRADTDIPGGHYAWPVVMDADGSMWWFGWKVLWHFTDGRPMTQTVSFDHVNALAPDPVHGVWLGTDQGLAYSDGQSLSWTALKPDQHVLPGSPQNMVVDFSRTAWVLTQDGSLLRLAVDEPAWTVITQTVRTDHMVVRRIRAITDASAGGVWAMRKGELVHFGGTTTAAFELPGTDCYVERLVADSSNVWGWGGNCALQQFVVASAEWITHTLGSGPLGPVAIGADGVVYALGPQGLYAYAGKSIDRASGEIASEWRLIFSEELNALAADRQSGVWIASAKNGKVWHYKDGQLLSPYLHQIALRQIAVDMQNCLWGQFDNEVMVYDGKIWHYIKSPIGPVRELTSGLDGRVRLISDEGVAVYDPAKDKRP